MTERIVVHPFEDLRVEDYTGLKQAGEHAYAKLSGMIPWEKREEYMELGCNQVWVYITAPDANDEDILFYGVLSEFRLYVENGICRLDVLLRSGTSLMDYGKRIRSFQDAQMTYGELLDICKEGYEHAARIMTVGKGQITGKFILQYQETDWKFINRLASMNHTVVIADCSTKGSKFYFGLPDRKETITDIPSECRMECDMEDYRMKKESGLKVRPEDTLSCVWESRMVYRLGDWGFVNGRQMFVWKIQTYMKGSVLYHLYFMKPKNGFCVPLQYNEKLSGVTLFGKVLDVREEKVKLEILEDENRERSGACWFTYATVYSSSDMAGWYCMPEIGDRVRICFPTENEQEAYVANAYHEADAAYRKKPECKSWRNREGKEIRLSPEEILLTNNAGTYIRLSDEKGIRIVSEGSVSLQADGALSIASRNASVELSAPKKIKLRQGETEMRLGGDLEMRGSRIKL